MEKKSVLALDPLGTLRPQLQTFDTSNIGFHYAASVDAAKQVSSAKRCTVGLVMLDEPPALLREELEHLLAAELATEWIAIVEPGVLEKTGWISTLGFFHDYHTLPVDMGRLVWTIGHAHGKARLRRSVDQDHKASERFGIHGSSPVMQHFFRQLEKVVKADLPVLIQGESGTGKELVSRAIHKYSQRAKGPLIVVNCGAIPGNLIQSELFGHEKGAFTGAQQRKVGSIEAANGGVLFLDEIGDLPMELQANLLRAIQEKTIVRVGSNQPIPVDCRLVAATHVDLRRAIAEGNFREDLYYRLNVIQLQMPPLRERGGDFHLLADVVLRKFAAANKSRVSGFSTDAVRAMAAYHWPGNVRELINRVHGAVIMSENRLLTAADLGLENYVMAPKTITLEDARASFERDMIEACLRANGNNVTATARQLGISRVTLYRILNRGTGNKVGPLQEVASGKG